MTTTPPRTPRPPLLDRLATGLASVSPRASVPLPEGALACRWCGVAVSNPDPTRADAAIIYRSVSPGYPRDMPLPYDEVPLTLCDQCAGRRALAESLLAAHPRVRAAHGNVGVDRLDAALAALDAIGFRGGSDPMIDTLTGNEAALRDTIERLAPIGAVASWSRVTRGGDSAGSRWAHVGRELRESTVIESRALYRRQFESPASVSPPTDGAPACLVCGVGHLRIRPSDQARAWGERFDWDVSHLGGRPRAQRAVGRLCPACRAALAANDGAIGVAVIERALLAHLGYTLMMGAHFTRDLGRAWITLAPGSEPNAEPWTHLSLARIRRSLDGSPWVRRVPGSEPR